ncbi:uncharacterized protein LOC114077896 [Solanum pennellii]|uniref:Uncharacterized protein LOC114077896 n=1 Tax=Solanum pennellii TaxID=28526 RepID=A0ABM1VE99_SOLPN|nr:uncharacterized protein LOC114077896 [Solanum pennellii]
MYFSLQLTQSQKDYSYHFDHHQKLLFNHFRYTMTESILRHTSVFLSEILAHSEVRHRLFSLFHQSADQCVVIETIENAASTSNYSSLKLAAENILVSLEYSENTFSSFLLSLVYTLLHKPVDAALSLLHVFYTDPFIARVEIAPLVFEQLFLIHFVPILHWYNHQRSTIMPLLSEPTKSLSTMSREQASQLKVWRTSTRKFLMRTVRFLLHISTTFC